MKIKYRILVAPLVTLIILLISGIVAYQAISAQDAALEEINGTRLSNMKHGMSLTERIAELHTDMFRIVSWYNAYDASTQNQLKENIGNKILVIDQELDAWLASDTLNRGEKTLIEKSKQQLQEYKVGADDALFMIDLDVNSALGSMRNAETLFLALKTTFDEFNALQEGLAEAVFQQAKSDSQRSLSVNVVLLVIALIVAGLIAVITANRLLRQLGGEPADAVRIARQIAEGDLSQSYPKSPEGSLLESMSRMQQRLKEMVSMLTSQVQALSGQAQTMSVSAQDVAGGSDHQSQAATSIAATIEELNASINSVFANAQTATELSKSSGEQAKNGSEIILRTADEMAMIAASITEVSENVVVLGDSSEKISSVITVIQSIAEQTNLLALNAAIEAARAGDQGRGFAVVADEVRGLAGRTAQSTQEISSMVSVIQTAVATAVTSMQKSVEKVQYGVDMANNAGRSITEISSAADQALTAVDDITQALREQTSATDEIAASIANIAEMAATNSQRAQSTAADAKALTQISDQIGNAIGQFRC